MGGADDEARRKLEKPVVGPIQAASLALELFGLTVEPDSLKELDSYDDRNFLLQTASGEQYVLKVHNGVDSQRPAFIEAQNEAMGCARNIPGLWCPWPCLSVRDSPIEYAELTLPDGSPRRHAVRCLTFLPARLLGDVVPTCKLLEELGACAAKLNRALTAVTHLAAWREHAWDLRSTCELEGLLQHLEPSQLGVVRAVINDFRRQVLPYAVDLPLGVIHCDLNDQNVLVDAARESIVGVIDFGDLVHSWQINELAICAAYVLVNVMYDKHATQETTHDAAAAPRPGAATPAEVEGGRKTISPLLALQSVCRAYHAERALSDVRDCARRFQMTSQTCASRSRHCDSGGASAWQVEWACLPTLVSSRLAMSLTIGTFSAAQARARHRTRLRSCLLVRADLPACTARRRCALQDPDNEYLRLTLRPAWRALQLLRSKTAREWSELVQMSPSAVPGASCHHRAGGGVT